MSNKRKQMTDFLNISIYLRRVGKRFRLFACMTAVTVLFSGCGLFPEVDVTEDESRLIAEYAAGLLLKYESGHEIGLEKIEEEPIEEAPVEEAMNETVEETAPEPAAEENTPKSQEALEAAVPVGSAVPMAEAMGLSGFEVTFKNYEVCEIYPEEESEDMFFSMQASPGKDLLIVHFDVTNLSETDKLCNMVDSDVLFRLVVNDSERINEQTTILLNDLKQYQDTIAGFGMVDTVLVFEIEEGAQENFTSLQLLVKDGDVENSYPLM